MAEKKLTAYEEELKQARGKILGFKQIAEANICAIIFKEPELLYSHRNLKLESFSFNMWKVYFSIANAILFKEKKTLDEITINFYLEKHSKLALKFAEYGGYNKIIEAGEYVKTSNFESYIQENQKWVVVLQMLDKKFPIHDRISDFVDMSSEQIYEEFNAMLNHMFANVESDVKSYGISHEIDQLIDDLNEGIAVGLPFSNMPIYTKETGGLYLGGIHLIGGLSNVGKSTFIRNTVLPSCLKYNEPIVIFLSEEGIKKWQREILVWCANVVFHTELPKYVVRDGKYTPEIMALLRKCANWMKEQDESGVIKLVPLLEFRTKTVIKLINKYASLDIKHFCVDTFKADKGSTHDGSWYDGMMNMVEINDVVKPEARNLSIVITFQLSKASSKMRHYTQDSIGVFKSIVDPASSGTMLRGLFDDEYEGGKRELEAYRIEGKTRIPVKLSPTKKYQVLFIIKSREGSTDYQIILEHDLSRNILKEVAICHVPTDF
jgi:replicative DNA helicase